MFKIIFIDKYSKKSRSFLKIHPELVAPYKKTIILLKTNPFHPSLRFYKLKGRLNHYQSVTINMQYRILIDFIIQDDQVILIDIGDRGLYRSWKVFISDINNWFSVLCERFCENSFSFSDDFGRKLENLVFLHLRRQFKDLFYFKQIHEWDFIINKQGLFQAIQVCYELSSDNRDREINGLVEAMDVLNIKSELIVTWCEEDELRIGDRLDEVTISNTLIERIYLYQDDRWIWCGFFGRRWKSVKWLRR